MLRRLLPWLLFLPVVVVAGAWVASENVAREQFLREASVTAQQASLRLQDYVGARGLAADTLRETARAGPELTEDYFRQRSQSVQDQFGGFLALNWIDEQGVIRWVAPEGPNRAAEGRNVLGHPVAGPFFERARDTGADVATEPLDLFQGRRGFASYLPIGDGRGYLNAVFDSRRLVEDCFGSGSLEVWEMCVRDGSQELFGTAGFAAAPNEMTVEADLTVFDRTWRLELRPTPALLVVKERPWRRAAFGFALALALGLAAAVQVAHRQTLQGQEADRARQEALEELEESRRLEALGRLAGGVAHDVNNLLTTISGSVGLLRDAPDPALLDDIAQACRHGAELTDGLLAFSRRQVVRPRVLDLGAELAAAEGMLTRLIPETVAWTADVAPDLDPVVMDPGELNRVVVNLVANAVDAMPDGGALMLTAQPAELDGRAGAQIAVRDTGAGMSAEVAAQVFEPFFTTKSAGRGTGLGLASVRGAIESAGGRVAVTSKPDEGSRFVVWLPRAEGAMPSKPPVVAAAESRPSVVLLVEDQDAVRRVAAMMLERAGHQVLTAADADEGLSAARRHPEIDVLVTDVVMPGASGPELAAALRAERPGLAVVFTSGYAREQLGPDVLDQERCSWLPKPYDGPGLAAAIAEALVE